MSYSQPPKRPQGARQRTQDGDRRPSVSQSGSEASYSYTEDGVLSSEFSSQGARLSRSTGRRRGQPPMRSNTDGTAISMDSNANSGTDHMSSRNHAIESPESERPKPSRSTSDFVPFLSHKKSNTSEDFDPMIYASPSPSIASLRRGSDHEEARARANTSSMSTSNTPSMRNASLPLMQAPPSRKSSMPRLLGDNPSTPDIPPVPAMPVVIREATTGNESDGSNGGASGGLRSRSRWDTIRRAVQPRPTAQTPSTNTPTPSGLRLTPAASVISSSSAYGAASAFSMPRAGSAISSLSEAGLAPPPSVISSTSSNITNNSRSARAFMSNVVEQARSGVAGMSTGFSGMGLAGLSGSSGQSGLNPRGGALMTNSMMEDSTPFAKEVLQACWSARFGGESKVPDSKGGLAAGLAMFPAVNTFASANSSNIRRPVRKATTDGGMVVPGGSLLHLTQQQPTPPPNLVILDVQTPGTKGSLRMLHDTIVNHASLGSAPNQPVSRPRTLPLQPLILSTLMIPFLSMLSNLKRDDAYSKEGEERKALENEQGLAIEIFGLLTRTWTTLRRPQDEVERWVWCCQAAAQESVNNTLREWLLSTLERLITGPRPSYIRSASSREGPPPSPLQYPSILQSLLQELFLIYPRVSGIGSSNAQRALNSLVAKLEQGGDNSMGLKLDLEAIEQEYGVKREDWDAEQDLRAGVVTEAVTKLIEVGSEPLRRWFLVYLVESRWPLQNRRRLSPLKEALEFRKLFSFLRATLSFIRSFLRSPDLTTFRSTATTILMLLQTRAIPEIESLSNEKSNDLRPLVISILLELSNVDAEQDHSHYILAQWMMEQGKWKEAMETEIKGMILNDDWEVVIRLLTVLRRYWPGNDGNVLAASIVPSLFQRLVNSPQQETSASLNDILVSLAKDYPREFYRPLILCAGSANRTTVSTQLRFLTAISGVYKNFWIDNVKIMLMALMGDPGAAVSTGKGKQRAGEAPKWGKARLGQCVVYLELIGLLRRLRQSKKDDASVPPATMSQATDFFLELEAKIPVLLEAKELTTLSPFSIRLLVASLILEIRLFTRSLKSAPWLPRIVEWACSSHSGAMIYAPNDPFSDQGTQRAWTPVTDEVISEVEDTIDSIRALYSSSWLESMSTPRTAPRGLPTSELTPHSGQVMKSAELQQNLEVLASMSTAPHGIFQLLVAVSGILQEQEYDRLGPILWKHFLDSAETNTLGPVVFLLMQSAEKGVSAPVVDTIAQDLIGESAFLKRRAIERLTKLFSWRYQVLTQPVITDRSHRRPFRSGRPPLSFVPTDIGSANYIPDRAQEAERVQFASTLPPEIRRRLIELGWDRNPTSEDNRPVREAVPLSVSPSDRLAAPENASLASMPTDTMQRGVARRKSSSGGQGGGKKRPIFVAALAAELRLVLQLTMSTDPEIANISRHFLLDTLRDDPALFVRPIFEQLSELRDIGESIATLENTFRLQSLLPPAFTFLVFNHLAGLLKALSRDPNSTIAPLVYAYSLPSISNAVSHVSGMSIRELRKAKLDPMLLPSGSLWFSDSMLPGPMFPRSLPAVVNPLQPLPPALVAITMVRTAQNMTLINLLKRDPKEIHAVRKTFTNFTLPALTRTSQGDQKMGLSDFLPKAAVSISSSPQSMEERHLHLISLALARSHLLLVAQIFRCLSHQTNDYQEISQLLDGVNRIMLRHGSDLGIVTHSIIDYMLAMTRFRRMFSSNGGFMLIMPAIWKVYCEAEKGNKSIRDVIKYAVNRFHAIHTEVFIFQSIDAAAAMISLPQADQPELFASNVTSLFVSLTGTARGEPNTGGIQNMTKPYEREAIITSINDSPEVLMAAISNGESMASMVEQFESKPFPLDNLARLFLTIVADDPFILRAQNFLHLFRYITPSLYADSMSARTVIREGIKALGASIFNKPSLARGESRARPEQNQSQAIVRMARPDTASGSTESMFARANDPSNFNAMKQDYLHLIVAFTKAGGQLHTDVIRRALDLLRMVLRDGSSSTVQGISLFLREFTESALLRDARPTPLEAIALLSDISPLIYSHGYVIDFSGVFDVLTRLCGDDTLVENPNFFKMVDGFCSAALDALEAAAVSNTLRGVQFIQSFVTLMVTLVQRPNADPLRHLKGRSPSAGLLASFVLRVCFQMPLSSAIHSGTNGLRRAWLHLLGYAMAACEGKVSKESKASVGGIELERHSSIRQDPEIAQRKLMAGLLMALQVIKVIMVRAGEDIEAVLPDVWLRIATVIKDTFQDGNGIFSLAGLTINEGSSFPSPSPSRPNSPNNPVDYFTEPSRPSMTSDQPPRVVDYGTWSILEILCFYRTPLNTKLRLWLQEKLSQLEARRQAIGVTTPTRATPLRDQRRQSFSPFTKRRRSGVPSAPPSPDGSPSLRASRASGAPPQLLLGSPNTISTFDRFPQASPTAEGGGIPRIRHLGPGFQLREAKKVSSQANPLLAAGKAVLINRPKLVEESHRRVGAVRIFWGYESFTGDDMSGFEAWTMQKALRRILEESKELSREFYDVAMLEMDEL